MTIKNKALPTKRAISDLVFAYRHIHGSKERPLSFRDFAKEINQALSMTRYQISHQTLKNWEDRVHLPQLQFLISLAYSGKDWPSEFGRDALAILRPKHYQAATYVGQRALDRSKVETGPLKKRFDPYYMQGL